ncbi:hypothetical protein G7Y31_05170 [Corynebacterium lizhenjunii]|uniref:Secreted protein n=1 Tax=Corynebacterium lizhenjunii TaxID=2709394 RepID=A0A7T0KFZ1_9CORY|nr:hypothetical protein [Corynebacterium lizhenjunii]QPK80078.1 hypothetical protein G7Y31_05170 [Corynebacterium lizhenjunii]
MAKFRSIQVVIAAAAALVVGGLAPSAAQAVELTPNFSSQAYDDACAPDPLGQILCRTLNSSVATLQQDQGAFMAASIYSMDTGHNYPGAFGEMDQCARTATSSLPMGGARFLGAAACLLVNPDLRARVSHDMTHPQIGPYGYW